MEFDFGKVWAGEPVVHTFEVPNLSDRVLSVRSVSTTCGCTTTGKYDKQVLPGQVWKLEANLSTHGRQGALSKTITVTTDDPQRPQILLVLKGEVRRRFECFPAAVSLGAMLAGSSAKRTIAIVNKYPEPVIFTRGGKDPSGLKMTLREIEKGRRYELDVETVPPLAETPSFQPITLQADLKAEPSLAIPVYGHVQARIALAPRVLMVASPVKRDIRRELRLDVADGTAAAVTRVEASSTAIRTSFEPASTGQPGGRIQVTIPAGTQLPPDGETVTVHTDNAEFATLTCLVKPFSIGRPGGLPAAATRPAGGRPQDAPAQRKADARGAGVGFGSSS